MSGEPMDMTDVFNTTLPPQDEAAYKTWAEQSGRAHDTFDYDLRGAWKANAKEAENGHLPDTYKKPNHPTFSTESQYNGTEGMEGGRWVQHGGKWSYFASPYNLTQYTAPELQQYFQREEVGNVLILPRGGR